MLARFDARVLGDLVNDTGVRQTPTQLLTDPNLAAALDDGAGMITSAALYGERYTVAQLLALTGTDQAFLIRLNCNLTFGLLQQRRGNDPTEFPSYVEALQILELIKSGSRLFNVPADTQAGVPESYYATAQNIATVNLLTNAARPYFPVPRKQANAQGV